MECYLQHLDPARAAVEALYTKRKKNRLGYELFCQTNIATAIRDRLDDQRSEPKGMRHEVMRVLMSQLLADPLDFVDKDGAPKLMQKIPRAARMAIQEIHHKKWRNGEQGEGEETRLKLASKGAIGKTLGVFLGLGQLPDGDDGEAERKGIEDAGKEIKVRLAEMKARRAAATARKNEPDPPPK